MSDINRNNIRPPLWPVQSYVLGGILVLLFIAVLKLIAPFFTALLWATLLYIVLSPLHRRLTRELSFDTLKGKILSNVWAGVFTLLTLIIILIPVSVLVFIFVQQAIELEQQMRRLLNERPEYLYGLFDNISGIIRNISFGQINITADDIVTQLGSALTNGLQQIILLSGHVARNIGSFLLTMLLITFSVFFFYLDGPYLFRLTMRAVPIKGEYLSTLTAKFRDITQNLFLGYIIVAALQSSVAYIVYTIFGFSGSMVFGVLTFILVFIPMFGATLIWIPLGAFRILSGDITGGILFMVISLVLISGIDNVLRPFLLKNRIKLHPLIIFFAILGGLLLFGFNGFILGPVLVIFFLTVLDLFLIEHKLEGLEVKQENKTDQNG